MFKVLRMFSLILICSLMSLMFLSCSKKDKLQIENNPSGAFNRELFYTIKSETIGEYITVTSRNGGRFVLDEASESLDTQAYQLFERQDGSYIIVCKNNGRALSQLGDAVRPGRNKASENQFWKIESLGDNRYAIKNNNDKLLSINGEGNIVVNSGQEQTWIIEPIESKPWKFVWGDEFEGDKVDFENWHPEGGYVRNHELQYYTAAPTNLFVKDGYLVIRTLEEEKVDHRVGKMKYTSASINTKGSQNWIYGRFVLRAKLPSGQAIWPAFWMCGENDQWPMDGEIDIFELWGGGSDDGKICSNVHWMDGHRHKKLNTNESFQLPAGEKFSDDFHIFMLEWDEEQLRFYLDGMLYAVKNIDTEGLKYAFNTQPHFLWVNTAVAPNMHGWGDASKNTYPQDYIIDYVRVYQQK